jgi:hypothetical protein
MLPLKDPDITTDAQYYCRTLRDLSTALKREDPGRLKNGATMLHDNTSPHVTCTVHIMLCSTHWKMLDHPPHGADLPLYNIHAFGPIKY